MYNFVIISVFLSINISLPQSVFMLSVDVCEWKFKKYIHPKLQTILLIKFNVLKAFEAEVLYLFMRIQP